MLRKETMPVDQSNDTYADSLRALSGLSPDQCIPLPPRRMQLGSGQECLVQWQPGRGEGNWRLSLVKRPESTDEPTAAVQIFQADIDLARHASTIDWIGSDGTDGDGTDG